MASENPNKHRLRWVIAHVFVAILALVWVGLLVDFTVHSSRKIPGLRTMQASTEGGRAAQFSAAGARGSPNPLRTFENNAAAALEQQSRRMRWAVYLLAGLLTASLAAALLLLRREIMERKELLEERQFMRALIDNVPDFMYVKDTHSRFVLANRELAHTVGRTEPEDLIGKSDFDFYPEELASRFYEDDQSVMMSGKPLFNREEEGLDRHRKPIFVLTTKVPIIDTGGQVVGIAGVGRNITDRRKAELVRQNLEVELRHAQKLESIGQLAAGIAHEINTPTQYIGDNVNFLDESFQSLRTILQKYEELLTTARREIVLQEFVGPIEAAAKEADLNYLLQEIPKALAQAKEGVERVSSLVRAMKDFSHPDTKDKDPADLNHAIESTTLVTRNEWKYVADLKLELDPSLPLVPCILGEFNQVILNLIVNAAHAIADVTKNNGATKGTITVQTKACEDWAEVRVQDTGTGIPEAVRPRIFDPFFTTKDVGKGTGQGLAIARSVIVDKHDGTIHFETEMGKGTTFVIRIPYEANALTKRKLIRAQVAATGFPVAGGHRLVF